MIVIDIGNTNIVIGIYAKSKLSHVYRFETKSKKFLSKIKKTINKNKIDKYKIDYKLCVVSSVVPKVSNTIVNFFKKIGLKVYNINYLNIPTNVQFKINNPKELGNDRIANTIAAIEKYCKDWLILDFVTARTFDLIKNNTYHGCIIAPGVTISHDTLVKNASQLNKVSISKTKKIVGKNTIQAMKSGFYWGYTSLINGIIEKTINEKKYLPVLILTEDLATIFKVQIEMKYYHEPHLTLQGLYLIGLKKNA